MKIFSKVFGWIEVTIGVLALVASARFLYGFDAGSRGSEWNMLLFYVFFLLALSFGWAGSLLIKRKEWIHQAVPIIVALAVVLFMHWTTYMISLGE